MNLNIVPANTISKNLKLVSLSYESEITQNKRLPVFEFHIAKKIREKYGFDSSLFSISGNVIFANFNAVRRFTKLINEKRHFQEHLKISEVNSIGLIDEIYHYIFRVYEETENKGVFARLYSDLSNNLGKEKIDKLLLEFVKTFPPQDVYLGKISETDYLKESSGTKPNREMVLEEMILLYISNFNPANRKFKELFNEEYIEEINVYKNALGRTKKFFSKEKPFGPDNMDIISFLEEPILNNPNDLWDQINFIKLKWQKFIKTEFFLKILSGQDLMKEDYVFDGGGGGGGKPPTVVPSYSGSIEGLGNLSLGKSAYKYGIDSFRDYEEPEMFTEDIDWMPRVVILAKNTFVWMDQLSKKYGRRISTLNEIPDEELDLIASRNFTGLWLIGIWERSNASKKIKHMLGNIDAVASAYSLYDYEIAAELGGDDAYKNLNERATARGIRLASDMVPNHTGIYSKWVKEHPEYFIQSEFSPFPNYRFTGDDLSDDPDIQIRIEDGYWHKTDAAVVFERIDNRTGKKSYLYHGNDGTNMPWNDTAQLNLIKEEVREAVIQKIFHVARRFSIIRFDAAMTLAKKHFARLWFPAPGMGGDIPSRTDHSMSQEHFDSLFPKEFWREVVDRFNEEMPDTLLLAEAFWLMEGYFVRTLGMHRVYNTSFMNMLMNEENEKYRDLITNTLEFEPEILKRYVNFMTNPDEETAIKQFGTDDKYFGIATLMVTLPGLPMFGHGQVEGFTEKYGMEYKRAYYNEEPDKHLVDRHHREIFPLMKMRYLFSQIENFWLFDFLDGNDRINENVFAYTNSSRGRKALVFYNNKFHECWGKIHTSTPKLVGQNKSGKQIKQLSLADALNLKSTPHFYYIYYEHISGLEYIKSGKDIADNGFSISLQAFKYQIFLNFREVYDDGDRYKTLCDFLGGRGVPNIEIALKEMKLRSLHQSLEDIFSEDAINSFVQSQIKLNPNADTDKDNIESLLKKFEEFINKLKKEIPYEISKSTAVEYFKEMLDSVKLLNIFLAHFLKATKTAGNRKLQKSVVLSPESKYLEHSLLYIIWSVMVSLKEALSASETINKINFINELLLEIPLSNILRRLGRGENEIYSEISFLKVISNINEKLFDVSDIDVDRIKNLSSKNILQLFKKQKGKIVTEILSDDYVKNYLGVNIFEGIIYFSKENLEELSNWLLTFSYLNYLRSSKLAEENWENLNKAGKKSPAKNKILIEFKKLEDNFKKSFVLKDFFSELSEKSEYKLKSLQSNFSQVSEL